MKHVDAGHSRETHVRAMALMMEGSTLLDGPPTLSGREPPKENLPWAIFNACCVCKEVAVAGDGRAGLWCRDIRHDSQGLNCGHFFLSNRVRRRKKTKRRAVVPVFRQCADLSAL